MNYSGLNYYGFSIKDVNSHLQRRQEVNKKLQIYVTQIVKQNRQYINELREGIKMIKLSSGVEVSEETVVSALKAAGIRVEPKHIWEAGDVANVGGGTKSPDCWRLIVQVDGKLLSINKHGIVGAGAQYFDLNNYKFVGKQKDLFWTGQWS